MNQIEETFHKKLGGFFNILEIGIKGLYLNLGISKILKDKRKNMLKKLNEAPHFWIYCMYSFETTPILSLGKIFDDNSNKGLGNIIDFSVKNLDIFKKSALRSRKEYSEKSSQWLTLFLDEFAEKSYIPSSLDFVEFKRILEKNRVIYDERIETIKNRRISYNIPITEETLDEMYKEYNLKQLKDIYSDLYIVYWNLFNLFHNGSKPKFNFEGKEIEDIVMEEYKDYNLETVYETVLKELNYILEKK